MAATVTRKFLLRHIYTFYDGNVGMLKYSIAFCRRASVCECMCDVVAVRTWSTLHVLHSVTLPNDKQTNRP